MMSGKGKKTPLPAGQRSIAAFFAPKAAQTECQPAAKRARLEASPPGSSGAGLAGGGSVMLLHSAGHPAQQAAAPTPAARTPQAAQQPANIPSRDPVLHARFQNKLVTGAGVGGSRGRNTAWEQGPEPARGAKLTPLEQQVAALKKANPGVLLAIEVGYKFKGFDVLPALLQFFGEDAEAASKVLHVFAFPDHNYLVASVPVPRIHVHVRRLVEAGYRVGVVRQTETAALKAAGSNKSGPFERRVTAVYTRATLQAGELSALEEEAAAAAAAAEAEAGPGAGVGTTPSALWSSERLSSYLVCLVEEPATGGSASKGAADVGLVAIEASTGDVLYSQFTDGVMRCELESQLRCLAPAELLLVEPLSDPTARLLGCFSSEVPQQQQQLAQGQGQQAGAGLRRGRARASSVRVERVSASAAARYQQGGALSAVLSSLMSSSSNSNEDAGSSAAEAEGDAQGAELRELEAATRLPPLVLRALAHSLDYLRPLGVDAVLRQGGASFRPLSSVAELALSANALQQLEVLRSSEGGEHGSLLWLMDRTLTKMGGRLMRSWVSRPLREREQIEARLGAVEELLRQGDRHPVLAKLPPLLHQLPDLERSLTRALHRTASPSEFVSLLHHCLSLHERLGLHADLLGQGEGSRAGTRVPGVSSPLLCNLLAAAADLGVAAVARDTLAAIDEEAAQANDKLGLLIDDAQRFPEVASLRRQLAEAEARLEGLLPQLAQLLGVRKLEYVEKQNQGSHMLEVPVDLVKRVPPDWEKVSSTKQVVRYHPAVVKAALQQREVVREKLVAACQAGWLQLLGDFGARYTSLRAAVQALAALDCLNGLASLASSAGYCRPQLVGEDEPPQLHIVNGRHPVLDALMEGRFVPNDTHLEYGQQSLHLVTGPNMGGKSCYIRQAALTALMAQIGSFVPADSLKMHVFDGIYTRIGASDNLALGRSTFAEELGEASAILAQATPRSLVIIDELGRGTSTHDGVAIAAATLTYLATMLRPLCLFVTHYLEVAALHTELAEAGAFYMAYLQEGGGMRAIAAKEQPTTGRAAPDRAAKGALAAGSGANQQTGGSGDEDVAVADTAADTAAAAAAAAGEDAAQPEEEEGSGPRITMLYKLTPGVAQASFGLNVARMAGLPTAVCARAGSKAREAEAAATASATCAAAGSAEGGSQLIVGEEQQETQREQSCEVARKVLKRVGQVLAGDDLDMELLSSLQAEARCALACA